MTTWDLILALFYHVDEQLHAMPKHPEAHLWPREVVTLGGLHALKGVGNRAFHRWVTRDYRPLFPRLPERTRLCCLCTTHQDWAQAFLAAPTVLGVIDTYGDRAHPPHTGGSESPADWSQRPLQSSLDWRGQPLAAAEPVGVDRGVGLCPGPCRRPDLSVADSAGRSTDDSPE